MPLWADCETCANGCDDGKRDRRAPLDMATRRAWHCGWLPREEWAGIAYGGMAKIGDADLTELAICPGWLVRQPRITEIARAHWALEKGALKAYCPTKDKALLDGVAVLAQAWAKKEAEDMQKLKDKPGG